MKAGFAVIVLMYLFFSASLQAQDSTWINSDLLLVRLSPHAVLHVSWVDSEEWGRFSSNGLIIHDQGKALLFDTPMSDSLSQVLLDAIRERLELELIGFVPNHWHSDCTEGMDLLTVPKYANRRTQAILKEKSLPLVDHVFNRKMKLQCGDLEVELFYPGPAHAPDNIVCWLPSEKLLFAGCMSKSAASRSLGNLSDANLKAWPLTLQKLKRRYPAISTLIPGHGPFGGVECLDNTLRLLNANQP